MADILYVRTKDEGQFFERKGCYDYATGRPKRRGPREVAKDIAETLSAMANADGGTLAVGVEDNGDVTGVDYPDDRLNVLRRAPVTHVRPELRVRLREERLEDKLILLYEIDWSADVHQLTDGRYLLRVGDQNLPFSAHDIHAMKESKRRRATEMQIVPEASVSDLDMSLVAELTKRAGRTESPEEILREYRLAEDRNGALAFTLAALLLFGKDPGHWHPRCGIDFVKYQGTERLYGDSLNIVKRTRVERPLVQLIEEAYRVVEPQVRQRQQLVDLFFQERMEYPTFAWQEAIVNAVAHRDYRYEGLSIEIWMFDDRLEIRSPGELVEPVTLERLQKRERIHASRNPRIVRALTDFGYMREQGEGVPRMFDAMESEGLYPPDFGMEAGSVFTVTLRNTPVYGIETQRWLTQFEPFGLNGNQKRLLAYARERDQSFTSRVYQNLVHIDLYGASRDIKDLIRKGVVRMPKRGGRLYEITPSPAEQVVESPEEYKVLEPALARDGFVTNSSIRQALSVERRKATRVAEDLVESGWLRAEGKRRGTRYYPAK
jgi:ATP-dependent DNA helicase RecG